MLFTQLISFHYFSQRSLVSLHRDSFAVAEQEREGGIGLHVSPMTGVSDVGNLLTAAGFSLPTGMAQMISLFYVYEYLIKFSS